MTTSSRLAIAPAVAFALSFAVVLALGQLVAQIVGDGSGATSSAPIPSSVPTPPAVPSSVTPSSTGVDGAEAGTIEFDGRRYSFGPVGTGPTTFEGSALTAQVGPLDGRDVQVCLTIPAGSAIRDRDWTQRPDGRWCTAEDPGEIVHFRLEPR